MAHTEKEARKCWCPFARVALRNENYSGERVEGTPVSVNRINAGTALTNCIASECMAWRWVMEATYSNSGYHDGYKPTDKGFCGMAEPRLPDIQS